MTNYQQVTNNKPRGRNRKDNARRPANKRPDPWMLNGFEQVDWNKRRYTWGEANFPVFHLAPGRHYDQVGLIASLEGGEDTQLYFPYGTPPAAIKDQLDEEILAIMRQDAEAIEIDAEALDWWRQTEIDF